MKWLERWAKAELEPAEFWGSRYDDAVHEWGSAFIIGALFGVGIAGLLTMVCILVLTVL